MSWIFSDTESISLLLWCPLVWKHTRLFFYSPEHYDPQRRFLRKSMNPGNQPTILTTFNCIQTAFQGRRSNLFLARLKTRINNKRGIQYDGPIKTEVQKRVVISPTRLPHSCSSSHNLGAALTAQTEVLKTATKLIIQRDKMKSLCAIVFISIVLVDWIHAAPKLTNSQEQRVNYLEALFSDNADDEYIDDDNNDDDNMEDEIIDDEYIDDDYNDDVNMKDENIDDATMEDDQFDDGNVDEQKNDKKRCWLQENASGCWTDKDCCGDLKCKYIPTCAQCDGICKAA